jgi:SAM-dependent methyltransferase
VTIPPEPVYVLGHSAAELARLATQGGFFEPITRTVFERAGVGPGMRVLDIGCGAGDVSLLAARMVGPSGAVLGVDRAAEAVAAARARAVALGLRHVEFQCADLDALRVAEPVDALVGRFVLMHQRDPAAALARAARHVRRGGVVAIVESHMEASVPCVHSQPHSPTYDGINRAMLAILHAAGVHPDMGLRLRQVFVDAGLAPPHLALHARVEGGPDAAIYRYMAESLRSMLPEGERLGAVAQGVVDLDTLETRLRDEVVASGGVLTSPLIVGAWCRTA